MNITENHVKSLYQVADFFMQAGRFTRFYNSNVCQFHMEGSEKVFTKLRKDFNYQLCYSLPGEFTCGWYCSTDKPLTNVPLTTAIVITSKEITKLADKISLEFGFQFTKKEKRFFIPRGASVIEEVETLCGLSNMQNVVYALAQLDTPPSYSSFRCFDVRNVLSSLGALVTSYKTLAIGTKHEGYNSVLSTLCAKGGDYFAKGYPHDLLAHDPIDIITRKVFGLMVNNDYAASHANVRDNNIPTAQRGFTYFKL